MELETALPALDAGFIAGSGLCLVVGFALIKRGNVGWHRRVMLTATALAALFLVTYAIRWALLGSQPFEGQGVIRLVYFAVLISHIILAVAIIPMVIIALHRACRGDFPRHKRIARFTLPVWLYVAITGWAVYWMLYHMS